jgi:hypothetical protein
MQWRATGHTTGARNNTCIHGKIDSHLCGFNNKGIGMFFLFSLWRKLDDRAATKPTKFRLENLDSFKKNNRSEKTESPDTKKE